MNRPRASCGGVVQETCRANRLFSSLREEQRREFSRRRGIFRSIGMGYGAGEIW